MSIFSKLTSLFRKTASEPQIEPHTEPQTEPELPEAKPMETVAVEEPEEPKQKPEPKPRKRAPRRQYEIPLIDAFRLKQPDWIFILDYFKAANLCDPTWENLTKVRLQKFVDYMAERLAPNSVHQYATRLKVVLNMYSDDILLPAGYAKILSPKKVISTAVYLSEEELNRLKEYQPKTDHELFVRNMFLSSAYCGARHVDIISLNESNIQDGKLVFVAQKTKKQAMIPLKPIVADYIKNTPRIEMSDVGFNKIIRRICRNVGITQKVKIFKAGKEVEMDKCDAVSSHTARRSFASNLYLRGIDIYTISKLLQHSEIKLTEKYIVCGTRPLEESELAYFA